MPFIKNLELNSSTVKKDLRRASLSAANGDSGEPNCDWARDACVDGLTGVFVPVKNDLSVISNGGFYQSKARNNDQTNEKVNRFRFFMAFLGLMGIMLSMMSRVTLNMTIVEMAQAPATASSQELGADETTTLDVIAVQQTTTAGWLTTGGWLAKETTTELGYGETTNQLYEESSRPNTTPQPFTEETFRDYDEPAMAAASDDEAAAEPDAGDGLHFDWSLKAQNFLITSFYIGYIPSMSMAGSLADKYGSKYPLLVCVASASVFSALTPLMARYSFSVLIASRILLGVLQGACVPGVYDLFNKWLTATEGSIFVPMIKVGMCTGTFLGSSLTGLVAWLGLPWPHVFYVSSAMCALWSLVWCALATSTPATNKLVEASELHRITRKKEPQAVVVAAATKYREAAGSDGGKKAGAKEATTPWLLILTNPSVIALAITKYTYNLPMDFISLQLALYLSKVRNCSMETISLILSGGSFLQLTCITFVGWAAKVLVANETFGLSRTKWRKTFQGTSHFVMAFLYMLLPWAGEPIWQVAAIVLGINFFWMLGAGGESMVPYDLSTRYPATIVGVAHSLSVTSCLMLPNVASLILADDNADPHNWNKVIAMISGALVLGGLVFLLLLKAKPFLPGERAEKK